MSIDKNTILCGSFAKEAGSFGCFVQNNAFKYHQLNYIYKSFSVNNIAKALDAMKLLNIKGAGITMPFKKDVIKYLDNHSESVQEIGACNTVVNNNGILFGENTDFLGLKEYLGSINPPRSDEILIVGNGGMSLAVQTACKKLKIKYEIITRDLFDKLFNVKKSYIFNATPLTQIKLNDCNNIVYSNVSTPSGMHLAILQASYQFNLYTGEEFPFEFIFKCVNEKFNLNLK